MRKIIVSAAFGAAAEWIDYTLPTWEVFADLHDWGIYVVDERPEGVASDIRSGRAAKIGIIEEALQDNDLVLWIDADAMIVDASEDIAYAIRPDDFQALVMEQVGVRTNPNTGVWLLRQDEETSRFLADVKVAPMEPPFADQAQVMHVLGWGTKYPHGMKPMRGSEYLPRTGWMSPSWNTIFPAPHHPTRIRHFAGGSREQRLNGLSEELAKLVEAGAVTLDQFPEHVCQKVRSLLTNAS